MTAKHSQLGPSSAERWMNCAGSVSAIAALEAESKSSVHAAEGTVAHGFCELFVTGKITLKDLMSRVGEIVECDGFGIEITDEMVEAVIEFADTVRADIAEFVKHGPAPKVVTGAEVKVSAKGIDRALYGTADFVLYLEGHALKVYDFKYGKGVSVEAEKNKQMSIYALAAIDTFQLTNLPNGVELVIVQPRAGGVKRWQTSSAYISYEFGDEVKRSIAATRAENPMFKAGKWCRWCAAAPTCELAYAETQKRAQLDFAIAPKADVVLPDIRTVPIESLVRALEHEDYVNAWFEAVRGHLKGLLEAGLPVPGLKLVEGKTNRKWVDEAKVVDEFAPLFGEDALFEKKLLSPAKLEKIVGKGNVEHLTFKPEGSKSIAREDDPRPAAKNAAAVDFAPAEKELETVPAKTPEKPHKRIWPD